MTPEGLLVVDKPAGMTSHDVVARVRRLGHTRKVGHAGTLDPMATGVLLLGLGRATRLLGLLSGESKGYDATVRLGASTSTDDAEGEVVETWPASAVATVTDDDIARNVAPLTGCISQVPSSVSAIKVGGKRAYALVRSGETVELAAREVTVSAFDILEIRRIGAVIDLDAHIECSSGTYVRALARDLGAKLGVGGHLTALRRTRVAGWTLADATPLDALPEPLTYIDLAETARRSFRAHEVDARTAVGFRYGQIPQVALPDEPVAVFGPDGDLLAMVRGSGNGTVGVRALAVFCAA